MHSASKIKLIFHNVNSVGKQPKRGQVFNFLKKYNPDILILADTRLSKSVENEVKCEWGGYAYFSSFSSQARGVAILIQKNLPIKFLDFCIDIEGNILSILIEIENTPDWSSDKPLNKI